MILNDVLLHAMIRGYTV